MNSIVFINSDIYQVADEILTSRRGVCVKRKCVEGFIWCVVIVLLMVSMRRRGCLHLYASRAFKNPSLSVNIKELSSWSFQGLYLRIRKGEIGSKFERKAWF